LHVVLKWFNFIFYLRINVYKDFLLYYIGGVGIMHLEINAFGNKFIGNKYLGLAQG
jgi:hypothetical protein